MEKDSVETLTLDQSLQFVEENNTSVNSIPLPNQIPKKLNLSQLSVEATHSGTIEALLSQNEDLMSRLSINIRRNAQMEQKINSFEATNIELIKKQENLKDQILVLKQKDQLLSNRKENVDKVISDLKEKISILEIKYSEYYETSQSQLEENSLTISSQKLAGKKKERLIKLLLKNRRKAQRNSRNLIQKLAQLENQLIKEQEVRKEGQSKLSEAINHIQTLSKINRESEAELIETYEEKISTLNNLVEDLNKETREQKVEIATNTETYEKNVKLRNEIVLIERKLKDSNKTKDNEIGKLQDEVIQYRQDLKTKVIELNRVTEELDQENKIKNEKVNENKKLIDQVESLQLLWREAQDEYEKVISKNQSLQKLNQQLSTKLNQHRVQIKQLKSDIDQVHFSTKGKIKTLEAKSQQLAVAKTDAPQSSSITKEAQETLEKIEKLVADIQSGIEV